MGSLSPLALVGLVSQGVGLVQTLSEKQDDVRYERREDELVLKQLQQKQNLQEQQAAQNAALERDRIAVEASINEEERKRALKRAIARQKAQFGARGLSTGNGSSEAVLLGLFDETEEELAQRERLDQLRQNSIDLGLSQQKSVNVLQREQLQQSQRLSDLGRTYQTSDDAVDFGVGLANLGRKVL